MNTLQRADARGSRDSVLSSEATISSWGQGGDVTAMALQGWAQGLLLLLCVV